MTHCRLYCRFFAGIVADFLAGGSRLGTIAVELRVCAVSRQVGVAGLIAGPIAGMLPIFCRNVCRTHCRFSCRRPLCRLLHRGEGNRGGGVVFSGCQSCHFCGQSGLRHDESFHGMNGLEVDANGAVRSPSIIEHIFNFVKVYLTVSGGLCKCRLVCILGAALLRQDAILRCYLHWKGCAAAANGQFAGLHIGE